MADVVVISTFCCCHSILSQLCKTCSRRLSIGRVALMMLASKGERKKERAHRPRTHVKEREKGRKTASNKETERWGYVKTQMTIYVWLARESEGREEEKKTQKTSIKKKPRHSMHVKYTQRRRKKKRRWREGSEGKKRMKADMSTRKTRGQQSFSLLVCFQLSTKYSSYR